MAFAPKPREDKKFKIEPETEREFTSKTKGLIKTPKKLPPYRRGPKEAIDKSSDVM